MKTDLKVAWPCPWFGDYRVPVFADLNNMLGGNLKLFYALPDPNSRLGVTNSTHQKLVKSLGDSACGLEGKKIEFGDSSSDMANKSLIIRFQPDLYRRLKTFNPDIVIAETFGGWSIVSILYALFHHKKLMMFYERTAYVERNSPWWRTLYRKIVGKPVKTFLVNGVLTREYLQCNLGFKKQKYVEGLMVADSKGLSNSVSNLTEQENSKLRHMLSLNDGITFLFVGQIVERKGVKELLKAWSNHIKMYPNDNLLIIGTGVLLDQFKVQYEDYSSIHFLGRIEYDNIYKYYAVADVFIMPTLEDNWCLVVPEAMSCGLPVACSIYNGGYLELIKQNENGYCFDPYKCDDVVDVLAKFHKVNLKEMGQLSKTIIADYTPSIAAKKIYEACIELIEK